MSRLPGLVFFLIAISLLGGSAAGQGHYSSPQPGANCIHDPRLGGYWCDGGGRSQSGNVVWCSNGKYCQPGQTCCGNSCCSSGSQCTRFGCTPYGAIDCGSYYCNPGDKCSRGGGCIRADVVDCGDGRTCPAGTVCIHRGEFGGQLDDKCPTPKQYSELREMHEALERAQEEEKERKRQEAIAERKRKEEERQEAKRRKDQEERDAAKARSEARQAEAERRKKDAEAAKHRSNQQAVQTDRAAITSGISASSQVGSAQSAVQILQDLRKSSVLDRMNANGTASNQPPTKLGEQRRLITRASPSPNTASPVGTGSRTPGATTTVTAPATQAAPARTDTNGSNSATSWVQDFALNKNDLNNIPEDARREIMARLEEERRKKKEQDQAKEAEAEKVYQETFGREAAKQPAPEIDKSTPWAWVSVRTFNEPASGIAARTYRRCFGFRAEAMRNGKSPWAPTVKVQTCRELQWCHHDVAGQLDCRGHSKKQCNGDWRCAD